MKLNAYCFIASVLLASSLGAVVAAFQSSAGGVVGRHTFAARRKGTALFGEKAIRAALEAEERYGPDSPEAKLAWKRTFFEFEAFFVLLFCASFLSFLAGTSNTDTDTVLSVLKPVYFMILTTTTTLCLFVFSSEYRSQQN